MTESPSVTCRQGISLLAGTAPNQSPRGVTGPRDIAAREFTSALRNHNGRRHQYRYELPSIAAHVALNGRTSACFSASRDRTTETLRMEGWFSQAQHCPNELS